MSSKLLAGVAIPPLLVASLVVGSGAAKADSLPDALGPRELGTGEARRAAATGSTAAVLNPAGAALTRSYVIEISGGLRPDDGDEADVFAVSICDSVTSRAAACISYNYLQNESIESFHNVGLTTAVPLSERFFVGLTNRYLSLDDAAAAAGTGTETGTENGSTKGWSLDGGIVVKPVSVLGLAVVGHNLFSSGMSDADSPRSVGFGAALTPVPKLLVAADAQWRIEEDRSVRYGMGAEYFLSEQGGEHGMPLRLGYVYDDNESQSFLTGGIGYVTPRIALDFGVRKQVAGGSALTLQLGLRLFFQS
ncbi:MAG: hypothetical protein V2A73_18515 [Pseudomonadota bacterium]